MPSVVAVSRVENMAFAAAKKPLTSRPVTSSQITTASAATLIAWASRGGNRRPSRRVPKTASLRRDRATIRIRAATSTVTRTITGQVTGEMGSLSKMLRTSFCQPTYCQIAETTASPTRPSRMALIHRWRDSRGVGISR